MKYVFTSPYKWIVGSILIWILFLVGFLLAESYFFTVQVRELAALKEDYDNHLLALKKLIVVCETPHDASQSSEKTGEKKKSFDVIEPSNGDDFVTVTRDFEYLYRAALAYAARYGIEQKLDALYQDTGWEKEQPAQKRMMRQKSSAGRKPLRMKRRARQQLVAVDADIAVLKREHPFVWPLQQGTFWLSSPFGPRKKPNGVWGFHYGLDMAAPKGTPIRTVAHGVVIEARMAPGYGNTIVIAHSPKLKTRYAHLSKIEVHVGDTVEQGERIGRVGNTGNARGRNGLHLHFEVSVYGKRIDPFYFLREG